MGALVGLGVGTGLLLIWSALFVPPQPKKPAGTGRTGELLTRAGLGEVSMTGFAVLCVVCGTACAFAVQVVSRTPTVAVAFGLIGGYLPVAVVSGRARRRQRELAEVWPEAVDNLASAVRAGMGLPEALSFAARCGAICATGRGP